MVGYEYTGATAPGKVYLIGAGPGNPELITVRGWRLLQRADVVVYDRLVDPALLEDARPDAELIHVGKSPGYHTRSQNEINHLLVERARQGYQVVRLKGGDPFVFGRGGEEALTLRLAGIPFEVVPGISSAISVPAYAGIPVTQRGVATSFAVVTGHEQEGQGESATDWEALSRIPTLVILMGVGNIQAIAQRLLAAGRDPSTPAAAICQGATPNQRTVRADLATLAGAMQDAGLLNPTVIVIGAVAALHDSLDWFQPQVETMPLFDVAALAKIYQPTPMA